jgi:hypothetical protein
MDTKMDDINLVLSEYAAARADGSKPSLREWVARYPAFADELRSFALHEDIVSAIEPSLAEDSDAALRFTERAVRVADRLKPEWSTASTAPFTSLVKVATRQGVTAKRLAEVLGLSVSFVARLDQRLFAPSSIPRTVIVRLADAMGRSVEEISRYLTLPPRTALAANYRSAEAPAVREQVDFYKAIDDALDLSEEQKAIWRAAQGRG